MAKRNDRWSALSMSERADLIKLYVSNGIISLDTIKKDYNSFGDGGDTEPLYYDNTYIEPAVVKAFNSKEDYNRYYGEQFGKKVVKERDKTAGQIASILEYTPILGDGIDVSNVLASLKSKEYSKAVAGASMLLLPNALEKPLKGIKKVGRSITHAFNSKHLPTLLSNKFGKGIINPSMAVSSIDNTFDNIYGDVVLIGDKSLLDDSFLFRGDGDTSSIEWFTDSYDEVGDVFETSAKMRKVDTDSPVQKLSKEQFLGLESPSNYHEAKRNRITGLNEFKHAIVLESLADNPEMLEYLSEMGIPYTKYAEGNKEQALKEILTAYPELLFKNGGKLKKYLHKNLEMSN